MQCINVSIPKYKQKYTFDLFKFVLQKYFSLNLSAKIVVIANDKKGNLIKISNEYPTKNKQQQTQKNYQ